MLDFSGVSFSSSFEEREVESPELESKGKKKSYLVKRMVDTTQPVTPLVSTPVMKFGKPDVAQEKMLQHLRNVRNLQILMRDKNYKNPTTIKKLDADRFLEDFEPFLELKPAADHKLAYKDEEL